MKYLKSEVLDLFVTRALPTLYTDGEYIRSAWCHLARTSYTGGLEGL